MKFFACFTSPVLWSLLAPCLSAMVARFRLKNLCCLLVSCISLFCSNGFSFEVYDCFMFFNEMDILEIRLEEMYPYVDHFVIVESKETHQGKDKPLYYEINQERYQRFADKIIHVVAEERWPEWDLWDRERWQRNQIVRGLEGCAPDDIIIISDADEIIRGTDVARLIAPLVRGDEKLVGASQVAYGWYLNRWVAPIWNGSVATTYRFLQKRPASWFRSQRDKSILHIPNVGWHFGSAGGFQRWCSKLESFAHPEANTTFNRDRAHMRAQIKKLLLVPIDESFPRAIFENPKKYQERGLLDNEDNEEYL